MKKLVREPKSAVYRYICDITEEELAVYVFEAQEPPLGCIIKFNGNYSAIFDGIPFEEIHLSEDVTREMLNWMREKYPESPFIKNLTDHGFFEKFKM